MRELVLSFTEDPEWLSSVSQDITDSIHAELADVDADPELRASTYASADSVLRLIVDLPRMRRPPSEALPPPAAVDYAREFVRRGLPLDSLLRWVRSAAPVRAQVIDALLAGEPVDAGRASGRLGYELGRTHLAFAVWSDAPNDHGDVALAMIERAALQLASSLGTAEPLLVPRAPLCLAGWIGSSGDDQIVDLEHAHIDVQSFPTALAAFGSQGAGVAGFARSHREAFHGRRIARLTAARWDCDPI
jgi:hypothetical protein